MNPLALFKRKLYKTLVLSDFYGYLQRRHQHEVRQHALERVGKGIDPLEILSGEYDAAAWEERIAVTMSCADNLKIPRAADAGKVRKGRLVMHNGVEVDLLSYYDVRMLSLLMRNKGVHEPQEELVFGKILQAMKGKQPVMVEMGAYWAFYSLWFLSETNGRAFMVEAALDKIHTGQYNFRLNKRKGDFSLFRIGAQSDFATNTITLDDYCRMKHISFVDILHSDIEGFEGDMLEGASKMLKEHKVGYLFISTHSNALHQSCMDALSGLGYQVVASANMDESFSVDGVLVMKSPAYPGPDKVEITLNGIRSADVS
ncbi:MAG: FkbM family methyltransferase [Flavobacteriales bacterium]|nr:FkbM family methyltransferase [Flavobacteriales bacterium]